jgi:3,4-dihydroxy 2-butanone 4-phosphate synthase/GTP cyclohydrolase II
MNSIEEAIEAIRAGEMVIVVDNEDRENEGDLLMAADKVTPEAINFMATHGRGLICLPLTAEKIHQLHIPMMADENKCPLGTAFTVSIEAREGTTTGISAAERCLTIKTAIHEHAKPQDIISPGHIFPLRAINGGVLRRAGHTEAAIDLARLAGLSPAGVICEIMNDDGTMARVPDLEIYAKKHNMKLISIEDLISYRLKTETIIEPEATVPLPTKFGEFEMHLYLGPDGKEHVAMTMGINTDEVSDEPTLIRVHSECLTGDLFGSLRCDCQAQLHAALKAVAAEGRGAVVYMRQEGRGIGLAAKMRAYNLQDQGRDTVQANEELGFKADLRDYGIGAQIIRDLGLRKLKLLTNNPKKIVGIEAYGLEVVERVPVEIEPHECNLNYLKTKKERMGHIMRHL